jgi:hypothetical protein
MGQGMWELGHFEVLHQMREQDSDGWSESNEVTGKESGIRIRRFRESIVSSRTSSPPVSARRQYRLIMFNSLKREINLNTVKISSLHKKHATSPLQRPTGVLFREIIDVCYEI